MKWPGNAFEWSWDAMGRDHINPAVLIWEEPPGGATGIRRVERDGGLDFDNADSAQSARRNFFNPALGLNTIGFRCVCGDLVFTRAKAEWFLTS